MRQLLSLNSCISLKYVLLAGVILFSTGTAFAQGDQEVQVRWMPAQTTWDVPPEQVQVSEGYVDSGGVKLWYWDTGGTGEPVVLLHPLTGSAAIWSYQQPVLAAAGFRVIAYSRRGHYRSESGPSDDTGSAVEDLDALVNFLGLKKFHLLGTAGGGFIVPDYALSYPEKLLSITIACSTAAVTDEDYQAVYRSMIRPPEFAALPSWLKELGPSYRAANPGGVAEWIALEESSGHEYVRQTPINDLTWDALAGIDIPTLLIGADADMYMPPSRLRELAAHMNNPEVVVISESGHSAYWEQPKAFNEVVIDFLSRH